MTAHSNSKAATPAVCAAARLVPDAVPKLPFNSGTRIPTPGAAIWGVSSPLGIKPLLAFTYRLLSLYWYAVTVILSVESPGAVTVL